MLTAPDSPLGRQAARCGQGRAVCQETERPDESDGSVQSKYRRGHSKAGGSPEAGRSPCRQHARYPERSRTDEESPPETQPGGSRRLVLLRAA